MEKVKYSFIMAAYNAEKYIDCAIQSVINQSYSNWELVVVNDGSVDSTENIVQKYKKQDSRIKLITIRHTGTASQARNEAFKYLTGSYIQILDSDDYISPDFLEYCTQKLEKDEFDILVPDAVYITDEQEIIWEKKPVHNIYDEILNGESAFMYSLDWQIHGVFMVKYHILKKIKYDPELIDGDEFTTRKLLFSSSKISFFKGIYYYRKNMESTTLSPKNQVRMLECLNTKVKLYDFSLENNMNAQCINLVRKQLIKSIVSYQLKFEKLKKELSEDDYKKIETLLKKTYNLINLKMLLKNICCHSIILILSMKSYKLFDKEIYLIAKFY